ncbi:hypothetical protein [Tautonia plasticadhaerens]|uniref:Uncharacterized protein n=1 Tax=Tautonia plasticadhaerens TaxID=2527974 RepID=A0A518HDR6_9BACT|nr:hypothetical protein [Tautonia plasticadhaerens]QDV38846.1 hypothetical protein ElP_68040 [Tautonia plasticadhaerens]
MAHDPREPDDTSDDAFGYGQQPLRREDATTGDEGIEPPVGRGHDEATIGRPGEPAPGRDAPREQVHGYPDQARGPDAQE